MNHESLWTLGNKLRASEGRGEGDWDRLVMGSKEGTYCMVHWVLYATNESLNSTPKLIIHYMLIKLYLFYFSKILFI